MTTRIAAAFVLTAVGALHSSERVTGTDSSRAIERFLQLPTASSYRALRHLEGKGPGQSAWLDAQTSFTTAGGLRYQVTGEGGSGYMRSRILHALLEEERRMIATGVGARAAISRANYRLTAKGLDVDGVVHVALEPLRKEPYLVAGGMFLNRTDGSILRLEGQLAKNPSFWITQVNVVRSYRRVNGALMPVSLESTAQLRFTGTATLRMTYRYTEVNDKLVRDSGR